MGNKNTPQLTLRAATDADGPGVVALVAGMYARYENSYCDPVSEEPELMTPASSFDKFWVLEHPCGWIVGSLALNYAGDTTELKKVYLLPRFQGQGWGSVLWARAVENFQGQRVIAWSDTRFHSGHQFYFAKGFRQGGTRQLHDLSQTQEFLFEKEISHDI